MMRWPILALSVVLAGECAIPNEDAAVPDGSAGEAAPPAPIVPPPVPSVIAMYEPMRVEPPRIIVSSERARTEVSIVPPLGDVVRACADSRCEQADWYAGSGGYTIVVDVAGERHSAELMLYGDELAIATHVSPYGTRIEIDRPAPPGVRLERGTDWGRAYSGDAWAPFMLRNESELEWDEFAFGRTLAGHVDRLEAGGQWRRYWSVDCGFGGGLVVITPGSVWPAGGQGAGALAPASHQTPAGRYRFVITVPGGHYSMDGISVYTRSLVTYEMDLEPLSSSD